jgi:hypothetical protein
MPIGDRAIPYSVKYTEYKPGTAGEKQGNQVPYSCFPQYPTEKIKYNEAGMKKDKKEIQYL